MRKWYLIYVAAILLFTVYAVLDLFVIPHKYETVETTAQTTTEETTQTEAIEETTAETTTSFDASGAEETIGQYSQDGIEITVYRYRLYDTDIYVADCVLSSADQLQTAFAQSTYGKNVTQKTSEIAEDTGAVLAINGDYYGARESGYVIRNGVIYRNTSSGSEDLVIYGDGTFEIVSEDEITAEELLAKGARDVFSFGPGLVEDGEVTVSEDYEVAKAMADNPRTAIGQMGDLHYVLVVSDGRTDESTGLSVRQLAEFMKSIGCVTAYNLDGGGSSTMVFRR